MPVEYYPIFVLLLLATGLVGIIMVLPGLIAPHRSVPGKFVPYESGIRPIGSARRRFHIRFSMIAMLFILFDIEVVFLYPVAVQLRAFGTFALVETIVFIALLLVAFVYVWRRGALEWR